MLCKWLLLVALPQEVITIYSCLTQCIFSFAHHPAVSINNVLKYFYFKAFFCDQYFWDISASWGNSKYCSKNITQMAHQASGHKMIKYWYYQKGGRRRGRLGSPSWITMLYTKSVITDPRTQPTKGWGLRWTCGTPPWAMKRKDPSPPESPHAPRATDRPPPGDILHHWGLSW